MTDKKTCSNCFWLIPTYNQKTGAIISAMCTITNRIIHSYTMSGCEKHDITSRHIIRKHPYKHSTQLAMNLFRDDNKHSNNSNKDKGSN